MGFIWPAQMLPAPMHWIANVLPATPGILGVLRLEAMGADWAAVEPLWWQLWAQVLGIGAMAWWSLDRRVCQPLS